jgi:hypothetical protein
VDLETSRSLAKSHGRLWLRPLLRLELPLLKHKRSEVAARTSTVTSSSMIIRSCIRARVPSNSLNYGVRMTGRPFRASRRYSTSGPATSNPPPQSQASMLATITTDLDKIAPRFEIQPEQIEILKTPAEFYQTLKVSHVSCLPLV